MTFEIIPNDPFEALEWYKQKLEEVKKINFHSVKNGYEPLGGMVSLMLNYSKNIRYLKKRIKEIENES